MRRTICLLALLMIAALLLVQLPAPSGLLPGARQPQRQLIRIWAISAPGGGMAWLKQALRHWEGMQPGRHTYLRQVTAEELLDEQTVLPDVILYMPGDLTNPSAFVPLTGTQQADEALLRCGRWQGAQVGLPLCWGGYVLAISSKLEPGTASTPAPTTLLSRPAATADALPSPTPPYPVEAARGMGDPLQCPRSAAMFALTQLLPAQRPTLSQDFASLTIAEVYTRFLAGKCASAILTTGQAVALENRIRAGDAPACRMMTADEIITDQVWLASLTRETDSSAADLLAYLVSTDAQRQLAAQGLHPVRSTLCLYAEGTPAAVQRAAMHGLTAINAFQSSEDVARAAWQAFSGQSSLDAALLPLL